MYKNITELYFELIISQTLEKCKNSKLQKRKEKISVELTVESIDILLYKTTYNMCIKHPDVLKKTAI